MRTVMKKNSSKSSVSTDDGLPSLDENPTVITHTEVKQEEKRMQSVAEFEATVMLAKQQTDPWIEVEPEFLTMLCGGKYPDANYMVYKGVKVAATGKVQQCQEDEQKPALQHLFR